MTNDRKWVDSSRARGVRKGPEAVLCSLKEESAGRRSVTTGTAAAAQNQATVVDPQYGRKHPSLPPSHAGLQKWLPIGGLSANNRAVPEVAWFYTATMA